MNVTPSENYDAYAMTLQAVMIKLLDDALKKHSLSKDVRSDINETFQHSLGMFLDQRWFECSEKKIYPIIVFSEKHWQQSPSNLVYNSGGHSYCDFSVGCNMDFYDGNEWVTNFDTGTVDDSDP